LNEKELSLIVEDVARWQKHFEIEFVWNVFMKLKRRKVVFVLL